MAQSFSSDSSKPTVTSCTNETRAADERQPETEHADLLIEELSEHTLQLMWTLRQEAMRAFEPLGMRPMKALLLELIGRGLVYPKELSEMLDTLPPAVSAIVADLEERGLLQRGLDPNDKRKIRLELTPDGQTMRQRLKTTWHEAGASRLARLSSDELATLVKISRKLLSDG